MDNKQIIKMLCAYRNTTQTHASRLIGRFPQALNTTLKANSLSLDDFLKICDGLNLAVNITDGVNGAHVLTINKPSDGLDGSTFAEFERKRNARK